MTMDDTGIRPARYASVETTRRPLRSLLTSLGGAVAHRTGCTFDGPWQVTPNAQAGVEELAWLEENENTLGTFAGRWIAILGQQIVASGDSFDEAYDEACRLNLSDTLIVPVPEHPGETPDLIA